MESALAVVNTFACPFGSRSHSKSASEVVHIWKVRSEVVRTWKVRSEAIHAWKVQSDVIYTWKIRSEVVHAWKARSQVVHAWKSVHSEVVHTWKVLRKPLLPGSAFGSRPCLEIYLVPLIFPRQRAVHEVEVSLRCTLMASPVDLQFVILRVLGLTIPTFNDRIKLDAFHNLTIFRLAQSNESPYCPVQLGPIRYVWWTVARDSAPTPFASPLSQTSRRAKMPMVARAQSKQS